MWMKQTNLGPGFRYMLTISPAKAQTKHISGLCLGNKVCLSSFMCCSLGSCLIITDWLVTHVTSLSHMMHCHAGAVLQHRPIPGLYHASASLRGLLKSGLGRIGLLQPKQPHPSDHKTVIVFVLGGICMAELRSIQQAVSNMQAVDASVTQVLAGGTALTRSLDVYCNVMSDSH